MRISDSLRSPSRAQLRLLTYVFALVLFTVTTRLPLLGLNQPIDDEVVYGVVAQTIVDGGAPYVSAVERKPPLLFYVYATVLRAFGTYNWRALHGVEIVWILATMGGLYVIGRRLFDTGTGLVAALLYSIFQAWSYWNNLAFNGEVLMNLPIVWAYVLGFSKPDARRLFRLFVAGGLLAIGFLLKQPAAIALAPLAFYEMAPWFRREKPSTLRDSLGQLFALALGFSMVLIAAIAWLLSRGLLGEAFYWTIADHAVPRFYWVKGIENTLAFTAFCLPITAGAWLSVRSGLWNEKRSERNALIALVVASLIGAGSSGRFYPHYYIAAVPPCALLAAPWLAQLWRAEGRERLIAFASQAWLAATVIIFATAHVRGLSRQPTVSAAGQYLMTHSTARDRIFVWGQTTRIYVDARRRPASRYVATFPLTGLIFGAPRPPIGEPAQDTRARIIPGSWDHLREDFAQHEPAFIVDTESLPGATYPVRQFPALERLLATEYEPVAHTADGIIYKRDPSKKAQLAALRRP
jgi:4-amino-4-deoxy-L-arabinose transferase-like glycosyltransferase